MEQQVNDISETLTGLLSELQSLRKTVESLYVENRTLSRNVDKLLKENRDLRKRLEKYEKPPKDSGNNSTPPSKEPMRSEVERRTKSLRQKSDKQVGGQKGHEGTTRKMVSNPDEIENVHAQYCQSCGRDLSDIDGELDYVTQEVDLPPIVPVYRERRFYKEGLHMWLLQPWLRGCLTSLGSLHCLQNSTKRFSSRKREMYSSTLIFAVKFSMIYFLVIVLL